ncbi:MAG: hypothetical protein K2X43_05005 [Hyphomonadaceae bacterium]|jgi:hypothetical protein|nr:hypothetical protein [Hyphomonadaceae bacterium]
MVRAFIVAVTLALAPVALAHGTGAEKGQHGGQVVMAGHDHLELVAKDGELTLYIRGEDNKPESAKGAVASATVLSQGKQEVIKLELQGDSILTGKGSFVVAKGMRVVVSLARPEHKPVTARFTPAD